MGSASKTASEWRLSKLATARYRPFSVIRQTKLTVRFEIAVIRPSPVNWGYRCYTDASAPHWDQRVTRMEQVCRPWS